MPAVTESKYLVTAGWDDAAHLSEDAKRKMLASTPPFLREARSKGTPSIGAGAIFPVDPAEFLIDPIPIPSFWRRAYGLDVGWNRTAAVWGAHDVESDVLYLTSEHYRGEAEPPIHAAAIKARGEWIPGVIDPASRGRSQIDGKRLFVQYQGQGLRLHLAENSVESGLYEMWERLSTGRLKVFRSLENWRREHMTYSRDEKGAIIKRNDHLMDATRYLCVSGLKHAIIKPVPLGYGTNDRPSDAKAGY